MIHVTHFALIFALGFGLAAVTVSVQIYRKYLEKYLLYHLYLIISINILVILNLGILYFYQNFSNDASITTIVLLDNFYKVTAPVIEIYAVFCLLSLVRGLLGQENQVSKRILIIIAGAVAIIQFVVSLVQGSVFGLPANYVIYKAIELLIFLLAYIILIYLFLKSRILPMPGRRKTLMGYSGTLLMLVTVVLLFNLGYILNFIDASIYFASGAVLVMLVNLIPVMGNNWFLKRYFITQDLKNREIQVDLTQLYKDFNITDREQEVIKLICDGKTNKEIADSLFISIQTVKDHVYRVFKKVGIRNRVQLTNIFGQYPDLNK